MGKHDGGNQDQHRGRDEDPSELARLVEPDLGWPGEYPGEDRPTNENLWSKDDYYDQLDMTKRNKITAIMAVILALIITGVSLSLGWMFGTGTADDAGPARSAVTRTETDGSTITETERVTLKGQRVKITKTRTKNGTEVTVTATAAPARTVAVPGQTVFKTITKTIKPKAKISIKVSTRPGPTVTITEQAPSDPQCYRVNRAGDMIEIGCP